MNCTYTIFFVFFLGLLLFNLTPTVLGAEGNIKLLAISEDSKDLKGSIADLHLETRIGSGRVFLETFPLAKTDTQISMRFAKQVACNNLPIDCNKYDFIYTLRSSAPVIGGPSAGAAAAVLTYSVLTNLAIKEDIVITGTINAGGFVGTVGGIKQKIEAAKQDGMTKVLIPVGRKSVDINNSNKSIDLITYGKEIGIEVIEVTTLEQALTEMTGKTFTTEAVELTLSKEYQSLMQNITEDLCKRAHTLSAEVLSFPVSPGNEGFLNLSNDLFNKSETSFLKGDYYSAASFCFRINLNAQPRILEAQNLSSDDITLRAWQLRTSVKKFADYLHNKSFNTLSELQTLLIVDERLVDAKDYTEQAVKPGNNTAERITLLAAANERLYSAVAWSNFYELSSKSFIVNMSRVTQSCEDKIREAEERYQYVQLYLPQSLAGVKKDIERAADDYNNGRFVLCLGKASKAKAEADMVITVIGVPQDQLSTLVGYKLDAAKRAIANNQKKGLFPIAGYSYYQYATSLNQAKDYQSALLFTEYALEFSNLDIYFEEQSTYYETPIDYYDYLPWLIAGAALGLFFASFFVRSR